MGTSLKGQSKVPQWIKWVRNIILVLLIGATIVMVEDELMASVIVLLILWCRLRSQVGKHEWGVMLLSTYLQEIPKDNRPVAKKELEKMQWVLGKGYSKLLDRINEVVDELQVRQRNEQKQNDVSQEMLVNLTEQLEKPVQGLVELFDQQSETQEINLQQVESKVEEIHHCTQRLFQFAREAEQESQRMEGYIEINALLQQGIIEYQEQFEEQQLVVRVNRLNKKALVYGDGEKIWNGISMLFEYILAQSKKNTRLYIRLTERDEQIVLGMKMISEQPMVGKNELIDENSRVAIEEAMESCGGGFIIEADGDQVNMEINFFLREVK